LVEKAGRTSRQFTRRTVTATISLETILLKRFPGAKAVATSKVLEIMKKQNLPASHGGLWNKRFPG